MASDNRSIGPDIPVSDDEKESVRYPTPPGMQT